MKYLKPLIGAAVLIGLMLIASVWAWVQLGDAPMAVHFGVDGRPDRYGSEAEGLLVLPAVSLALTALFAILPPLMPARSRLERSWGAYVMVWLATLVLMLVIHLTLIAFALGVALDMTRIVAVSIGGLLAVIGNVFGKVRYNYVFGFRTPWTLSNEQVWDRTHRFTGWGMTIAGVLLVAVGLLTPPGPAEVLLPVAVMLAALTPVVAGGIYSFRESRRIEREAAG